ncbi:MAG: C1 family peptidase [Bacteroidetes bacterium]|nr:C1 family peptidase [Bacteroidota bacterium]
MKRILILFLLLPALYSFSQDGSIDEATLQKIRSSFTANGETRALMNAISSNDIKKLAINRSNLGKVTPYFSHKIDIKGISDQKSSGRCWLFTGLNMLRIKVIEKYKLEDFEFSQNYSFFWDQLEKSNLFLETILATADKPMDDKTVEWLFRNPIGDGGQWTGVVDIVDKYGLVPAEAMPESQNSENTSMMSRLLRRKLREDGLKLRLIRQTEANENVIQDMKTRMLSDIYRILALSLGEPPQKFIWQYKDADGNISKATEYTPLSFYSEVLDVNLKDYVMLMNDPTRDYYKVYEIEYDRHILEGGNWKYINLPVDEIKNFAAASIKDNEPLYFSCDVGKQLNSEDGLLDIHNYDYGDMFGVTFGLDKAQRISTFESGSSHGMSLIGVNIIENGSIDKWLLENSWGEKGQKGLLVMTDEWFDEYMFRLVVHQKYMDQKTLDILKTEPVLLPPWDPMFAPEN